MPQRSRNRLRRLAALVAVIALGMPACTGGSVGAPSKLTPATFVSVIPATGERPPDYVPPKVRVAAEVVPNTGIRIGMTIAMRLTLTNDGDARRDLFAFFLPPSAVEWRLVQKPTGAKTSLDCGGFGRGNPCFPKEITVADQDLTLARGETKTITVALEARDYLCPAGGDFIWHFFIGLSGGVANGPNSYRIFAKFENDADDYELNRGSLGLPTSAPVTAGCKSLTMTPPAEPSGT